MIVDNPDGTSHTSPTCIVSAANFDGKAIRTVEGHAKNGELSAAAKSLYRAFCLPVRLLHPRLPQRGSGSAWSVWRRRPVARADLEKTIAEALDGHLCRCTGYIKYHEAVRDVILGRSARYLISSRRSIA